MRFETFIQAVGRAVGEAMGSGKFQFDGDDDEAGVRLAELDTQGAAPEGIKVALAASDLVTLRIGENFAVRVDGDADDALRFAITDNTLKIMRKRDTAGGSRRIEITMPTIHGIAISGAGTVEAEAMGPEGSVAIGGAGTVRIARVEGERFKARIGGSGTIEAAGRVDTLSLAIGGSGKLAAAGLMTHTAHIKIGGSGKAEIACDGEVEAKIGGVGDIVVHGQPRVSLKAGGAGKLRCVPLDTPPASEAA